MSRWDDCCMTDRHKPSSGDSGTSGPSRRHLLGMAGLLAAGFSMSDLALLPALAAQAAVQWFHPFQTRGTISSGFGPRTNPVTGAYQSLHDGIDYSPPGDGTAIRTVASGTVTYVQPFDDNGYGYQVIVGHADGYETLYGHMRAGSLRVTKGQRLGASAIVGLMGATGSSRGAHLHLRLHRNGTPVDPTPFVHNAPLATANEQPISDQGPLMALSDAEQTEILNTVRAIAGFLYAGGTDAAAGTFDNNSVIGRVRSLQDATFYGGTSMQDGGKSMSKSLAEINSKLT